MIKDILIPGKVGSYYLASRRVLGFDIGKSFINATVVNFKGTSIIVEKFIHEQLEAGTQANYNERVSKAIKAIVDAAPGCDAYYSCLSSSLVVFKELKFPFLQYEKIAMVVEFEVESLLPFAIADAVVDFIITKQDTTEKNSEVLIAAVQNQHIAQHIQYFHDAGLDVQRITVDFFGLYDFYKQIPSYASIAGGVALIDLGVHSTRICYIQHGQIRFIRTLQKGLSVHAKMLGDTLNIQLHDAMAQLMRFGLEKSTDTAYTQAIAKSMNGFWHEIQFTLQSFTSSLAPENGIKQVLLLGEGAELRDMPAMAANILQIPTAFFNANSILHAKHITLTNKNHIPNSNIMSLSGVLTLESNERFNLRKKQFAIADESLFNKQIIVSCALILMLFSLLGGHLFFQWRKLSSAAYASEQEAISEIKKRFPKVPSDRKTLDDIIEFAKHEVSREEKTWFAFSSQARSSFLKYLLELTTKLDKQGLGLNVEKITIADGLMVIKAQVKGHEELKKLQKDLKLSKLFSYVEPQLETDFTMKIMLVKGEDT
jgi:type IV pilus assembly protein PilM